MGREQLSINDFSYELEDYRIAKYPLKNRNESKLLTYKNGVIGEDVFPNLENYLPNKSILVFNDTKVMAARLFFYKYTGARIEVFCLEPSETNVEQAFRSTKTTDWVCMVGNLKRFFDDDVLSLEIAGEKLQVKIIERRKGDVVLRFEWTGEIEFSSILQEAGEMPLPPYLNRKTEKKDLKDYQTVYAKHEGAVAAPTAGLHFVENQLKSLKNKGHKLEYLTLFVGAGTFRSLRTESLIDHEMHRERIVIQKSTLVKLSKKDGDLICVGTTSVRSMESLYWLAVKMHQSNSLNEILITQEDAYKLPSEWSWEQASNFLISVLEKTGRNQIDFHSALYIMPGYSWKVIDGMITNFHQSTSTLLALVSAWVGDEWRNIYDYAIENDFRFLSYGDSSILLK
jgi:S-adenosylmethionine:tRNA ribosyltransferase-isomerase